MRIRDPREPDGWRDEGPSSAVVAMPGLGGSAGGFVQQGPVADGRCPVCGLRMNKGNQRSCLKSGAPGYGERGERRRGRGAFVFGAAMRAA